MEIGLLLMFIGACCLRLGRLDDYCCEKCSLMKRPFFPASETNLLNHEDSEPFVIHLDSEAASRLLGTQLPNRPRLQIVK